MKPAFRGLTLVEVLVVLPLLLTVFGVVLSFLLPGLRAWGRSDAHSQAQQNVLLVSTRLLQEMQNALPTSCCVQSSLGSDGLHHDAVYFVSDVGPNGYPQFDSAGLPLWQTVVVFYHDIGTQTVRLQEQLFLPPSTDSQQVPASTQPLFVPRATDRVVARSIQSLEFNLTGGALPLQCKLQSQVNGYSSQLETEANSLLNTFDPAPPATVLPPAP